MSAKMASDQRQILDQIASKLRDKERYEHDRKQAEDAHHRAELNTTATRMLDVSNSQKELDKANREIERIDREIQDLKSGL